MLSSSSRKGGAVFEFGARRAKLRERAAISAFAVVLTLACGALTGCQAEPSATAFVPGAMAGSAGSSALPGGGGSGGGSASLPAECANALPQPGRSPLRRLNRAEYKSTLRDLLGVDTALVDTFPPDNSGLGFTNNADVLSVTNLLAEAYMTGSEAFAKAAVQNLAALVPCAATSADLACAQQFIADFGLRALRRPLSEADRQSYLGLFTSGMQGGSFADGIQLVLQGMLQSVDFLYRVEQTDPTAPAGAVVQLNDYEMATRLSYFFWGSTPDKALLDAAAAKQLESPADIERQARSMLEDPKAKTAVASFHDEWLGMAQVSGVDKDTALYPEFTPQVRAAMRQELETFVEQVFWNDGKIETLFAAPFSYLNRDLAAFYGLPAPPGEGFQQVMLDPAQRAGVVTQGALLTAFAKPNQTSPVLRGKFVREQFFCQPLPAPPANLVIVAPEVKPGSTTRERFAQHEAEASCAACHRLMDGLGLGFEAYDPIGRWRTQDQGLPVDSSGSVVGTDVDGPFAGGVELALKLSQSAEVRQCVVKQWFRYANGRQEIDADQCTLAKLGAELDATGHDMRELRIRIALSDAFRFRSLHGGGT